MLMLCLRCISIACLLLFCCLCSVSAVFLLCLYCVLCHVIGVLELCFYCLCVVSMLSSRCVSPVLLHCARCGPHGCPLCVYCVSCVLCVLICMYCDVVVLRWRFCCDCVVSLSSFSCVSPQFLMCFLRVPSVGLLYFYCVAIACSVVFVLLVLCYGCFSNRVLSCLCCAISVFLICFWRLFFMLLSLCCISVAFHLCVCAVCLLFFLCVFL